MTNMFKLRNRKAISPVIATVILVAVAITIAVAVSYWMSGIAGQYTKFEKVEILSAQCSRVGDTSKCWDITLNLRNTGTAPATITSVYINDQMANSTDTDLPTGGLTLQSGQSTGSSAPLPIIIHITSTYPPANYLTSGTAVTIHLHSAGGMDYPKLLTLP